MKDENAGEKAGPKPLSDTFPPIGDYGIIGNGRTAALISRSGDVDWLCLPHFSGTGVFAALLDRRFGEVAPRIWTGR
ncbi:trehalase-like domain-containing protein [Caenispirillum salinarum]|uniref:trehalase-like domain-containing protein n=1 Tax=Caenispirillum salinarum TaxID=859058 RepID=UPI00384D0538